MSDLYCSECGKEASEFTKSDEVLYCQECCIDHEFERDPTDKTYCVHCGLEAPADHYTWVD